MAACMAHQFLHDLHILAVRNEQCGGMAKRVPSDMFRDAGLPGGGLDRFLQNRPRPDRTPTVVHTARKDPVARFRINRRFLPYPEICCYAMREGHRSARRLGFALSYGSAVDRDFQTTKVNVGPLESEQLASP